MPVDVAVSPSDVIRAGWQEIERRSNLTLEEFVGEYARPGRPVVIEGNLASWADCVSFERLASDFGDREVTAVRMVEGMPQEIRIKVADLIASVLSRSSELHLRGDGFLEDFPELAPQLEPVALRRMLRRDKVKYLLWISPRGKRSTFHHDTCLDNLNVQVAGRKTFLLIPPSEYKAIHPFGYTWSPIDPFEPDLKTYPSFAEVAVHSATIKPGEVIFIPKFWWHCVEARTASINVNAFAVHSSPVACWKVLADLPIFARLLLCSSLIEARLPKHNLHWLLVKTLYKASLRARRGGATP